MSEKVIAAVRTDFRPNCNFRRYLLTSESLLPLSCDPHAAMKYEE
jgi:hypothetical protein